MIAIIMARAITPQTIPTIMGSISGPSSESREGKLIFTVRIRAIKAADLQMHKQEGPEGPGTLT